MMGEEINDQHEEINNQHEEMSHQEMSDDLSSDSCFDSDMENDNEIIYRDLNRAQVNALNPVKKCYIEFYYTEGHGKILLNCRNKR